MIPCNHDRADSCSLCIGNRLNGFRSWRIHHGNQPEKDQIFFAFYGQRSFTLFIRKCQHTQSLPGKFRNLFFDFFCLRRIKRNNSGTFPYKFTAFQQYIRCSFGQNGSDPVQIISCAHPFPLRIKRNLFETFHTASKHFFPVTTFAHHSPFRRGNFTKHFQQGIFGRISDSFSVLQCCIIAKHRIIYQISVQLLFHRKLSGQIFPVIHINFLHGHLILCQRSGFIRTDHRYTSKTLHCLQLSDDGIFLYHLLCSHCLHNGHD